MGLAVILVAAGSGERLGAGIPKALVSVAGKTLFEHALGKIEMFNPDQLVVVAPQQKVNDFQRLAEQFEFRNLAFVEGGETRQDSVQAGLALVSADRVLVHDSARAFIPARVFEEVADALETAECVVPVLPIADTIKEVNGQLVTQTLDRSKLVATQTPQGFRTEKLRQALADAHTSFTDEAGLLESLGIQVVTVPGDRNGFKVTFPEDLETTRSLFGEMRTGIGTDAHKFSEQGELVLGCLAWPDLPKLEGHSDGDSIAHAIVDSLLSAAGLGDIGSNFGVDRPEYQNASGEVFINASLNLLRESGFAPVNISVQVVGDKPKIAPRRSELEPHLSNLVGAPVSVGATTTDGLGFLADARGVAAVATALIRRLD